MHGRPRVTIDVANTLNISQPSVSRILTKFLDGLSDKADRFIIFPTEPAAVRRNQREFHDIAGFPNVVALVDGTHIPVAPPREMEHVSRIFCTPPKCYCGIVQQNLMPVALVHWRLRRRYFNS